jgi:hypothetical protein
MPIEFANSFVVMAIELEGALPCSQRSREQATARDQDRHCSGPVVGPHQCCGAFDARARDAASHGLNEPADHGSPRFRAPLCPGGRPSSPA